MKPSQSAKHKIIHEAYIRLVLVGIFTLAATNICGFIDNLMIGRYLGERALAAVGYFAPMSVLTGLAYIIILGSVIVCGNYIGSGQQQKVRSLFFSAFIAIIAVSTIFVLVLITARGPLSYVLGARDEANGLLMDYILGYSPSILFASLSALFMSFASFNNELNRTYVATAAMFFGNILFDALLVKPLGILGIGLASTMSSLMSFVILLPAYLKKNNTVHLKSVPFDAALMLEAAMRGLPTLLFTLGMLVKNSLINYSMSVYAGYEGIAVVNIYASVCCIIGTISGGCTNAFSTLASVYYGEEDREALIDSLRIAIFNGLLSTSLVTALMIAFSAQFSGIFFTAGTGIWQLSRRMFIQGFLFFPVNVFINLLLYGFKAQGRMKLVNAMSFAETAMIGIFAVLTVSHFGADAVWLSNLWSDLLVLIIILISVIQTRKSLRLRIPDLLKLPDSFGAQPGEFVEYTVSMPDEASTISQKVIDFCKSKGIDGKRAYYTGLCLEEIVNNVFKHGISPTKRNHVNVRVVCKDDLIIRIHDDCRQFDPRERMNMYTPERPEKNLGLKMVAKTSKNIDYYNNAGINTLIIKM